MSLFILPLRTGRAGRFTKSAFYGWTYKVHLIFITAILKDSNRTTYCRWLQCTKYKKKKRTGSILRWTQL